MHALRNVLLAVLSIAILLIVAVAGYMIYGKVKTDRQQSALAPFYATPEPFPTGAPGTLLKTEPLTGEFDVPGADAYRMMYLTEDAQGQAKVSSGMIFIPTAPAPPEGRKVISWAHPTVGMGDACAPSRRPKPTALLDWLPGMIQQGWVVTASDYAGLGTDGVEEYLVAASEVRDVVNAVRAVRQFDGSQAGTDYGVFGHSQGGHAALWAPTLAPEYAPELTLVGVAGAAPAAPLEQLVSAIWDTDIAWVIGAEVLVAYPDVYPNLDPAAIASKEALGAYKNLAQACLLEGGLEAEIRQDLFGERFFAQDPLSDPSWAAAIKEQTAPPTPAQTPVLVTESVNDGVIAPSAIAAMEQQWCQAGSTLEVVWLGPLRGQATKADVQTHMYEGSVGGALATSWFVDRFRGEPATTTCGQPAPLAPPLDAE